MTDLNIFAKDVKKWLIDMGFTVSEIAQTDPNFEFNFLISNAFGVNVNISVFKPKTQPVLATGVNITISPEHRSGFSELGNKQKSDFIFEMQKNLLFFNVDFGFIPNVSEPQQITVNQTQYVEDVTRSSLTTSLKTIRNVALYLIWTYNNKFTSQIGPSSSSPTAYG